MKMELPKIFQEVYAEADAYCIELGFKPGQYAEASAFLDKERGETNVLQTGGTKSERNPAVSI